MATKKIHLSCADYLIPISDALETLNGKWKIPVLVSIMMGNERFTDIQNSIACKSSKTISPKVLTKELKELEEHQLIKRVVIEDYPVKILYKTQPYTDSIIPIIQALKTWGENHRKKLFTDEEV